MVLSFDSDMISVDELTFNISVRLFLIFVSVEIIV